MVWTRVLVAVADRICVALSVAVAFAVAGRVVVAVAFAFADVGAAGFVVAIEFRTEVKKGANMLVLSDLVENITDVLTPWCGRGWAKERAANIAQAAADGRAPLPEEICEMLKLFWSFARMPEAELLIVAEAVLKEIHVFTDEPPTAF